MRFLKKAAALLLAAALGLAAAGCAVPAEKSDRLQVICTVFPSYDFVRQIAGDTADVTLLLSPGQECHSYEPTPKDILKIQSCDLFVAVGGESETWVTDMVKTVGGGAPEILTLMDCVDLKKEELTEGMEGDAEEDAYDEHVWTAPRNAVKIVDKLTEALCRLQSENAAAIRTAAEAYKDDLRLLDEEFVGAAAGAARRTLIFADRFPFRYFADSYGLDCYAPFPGCADDAEPSAATVAFLIDKAKAESVPVVLYIEFSDQKIADTLCEATGAAKRQFHSCHNVTADELASGATYLSLMRQNLTVLKEALG